MTQYITYLTALLIFSIKIANLSGSSTDTAKLCTICLEPLKETFSIDAWNNPFHTYHEKEGVFCHSCSRIISEGITQGGFLYSDGRHVCKLCQVSVVEEDSIINISYKSVLKQIETVGFNHIPTNIPIRLINLIELNENFGNKLHGNLKGFTQVQIENNSKKSYEIFLLFGLPQIEFEAVLAHELLHIWLHENNLNLNQNIVEGFCNLGTALIYQNDNTYFSNIHLKAMENDTDLIYGEGYRKMKSISAKLGWEKLLSNLINSE